MQVIGYRRVSTEGQHDSGLGLEAQTAAVEQYAALHGHEIVCWEQDVASGGKDERGARQERFSGQRTRFTWVEGRCLLDVR